MPRHDLTQLRLDDGVILVLFKQSPNRLPMINQNHLFFNLRMFTSEYITSAKPKSLKDAVIQALKSPERIGGMISDGAVVILSDLKSHHEARIVCDVPGMLRIHAPVQMQSAVLELCRRLMGRKIISHKPFADKARVDEVKAFTPALQVLASHMAEEEFLKWIIVLPEARAGADACKFRNDGALRRYLANLLRFAKETLDPANVRKRIDYIAKQCGLSHFSENISETARRKFPEDYTALLDGQERLFPMHVTIGAGQQEVDCMSIHFHIDRSANRLVIARFGRHGRGESIR